MCCNIHGLILYLAKVALVAVELCEFALVWVSVCFFFSSVSCIFAVRLVSVLLRCRRFLPWDPAGSNTITVKSLMSQLIWKKIQTNNKKATRKLFDYFYWANFYKAAIFFNNNKSAYFLFIPFLFSFQKKEKKPAIWKVEWFPWWSWNCLTVSAESLLYLWSLVTASQDLVHQNVHFLQKTKTGSFSKVCVVYVCT